MTEGRYQLLVDSIVDYAIYMLTPDGLITSWNQGARRFKGYEADEIIGQHFSKFYPDSDKEQGLPALALKRAAEEGRFEHEGWRVRKDGTQFWASVVIDPIRDPAGALIGYAKVTRDLTERRAADAALQESEQQFRLLVKGVTDYAIYKLDLTGLVSSWNLGAERIKGYAPEEIIGSHFSQFYTPEDRASGLPQRGLAIATRDGRFETEGWRVRKDGTRFWAHVVIDSIRNEQGEPIGFAKVTRDVTEKRQAQAALDQAREALFQSQKMEAIGQLTGGVAHDFNNLLMAILGSLELAQKRLPDDPRLARLIDNAIQGAERGATLTQRMLAFARRQELKREAVDLATLVHGMTDLFLRSLGGMISIDTRFPLGLPLVDSDPAQLESALLNLVINARDAMSAGGEIVISGRYASVDAGEIPSLKAGAYVCLSVTDRGHGMDPDVLGRAMDPFFTTKGVGKGTGLGLSMVQGLASQSGGLLQIASQPGEGTTVTLWLPVSSAACSIVETEIPPAARATCPLTILAVDDDALVLLNTVAMLEDLGHTAFEALDAADALAVLRANPSIDLVITDQAMPGMTGVQLAEAIRAEWPHIRIIIATGYAELPSGSDHHRLAKPFNQAQLAAQIAAVMQVKAAELA